MKKTLTIRAPDERPEAPRLQRKGRGWNIAESRLDSLHDQAREMRRNATEAQALLADRLAKAELGKFRFRRAVVIGSAIVDFGCQALGIAVEVEEPGSDPLLERRRDRSLAEVGVTVLRFTAAEVIADVDAVVATVIDQMKRRYAEQRARKPAYGARSARPQARR